MAFLGRLFGRPAALPPPAPVAAPPPPPAPVAPPPPANSVVVSDDVAAALTAGGVSLSDAVDAALREHLGARERAAAAPAPEPPAPAAEPPAAARAAPEAAPTAAADRVPFWLARDEREPGIEDALRGKLERRRAAESERGKSEAADPDASED